MRLFIFILFICFREGKTPGNKVAQDILNYLDDIVILQFTYKLGVRL